MGERKSKIRKPKRTKRTAAQRRAAEAAQHRERTRKGQDIGRIPACKNPERREKCLASFALFCVTYFPTVFYHAWSRDLIRIIAKIERVVIDHDTLAIAMPRGSGKSALCRAAVLWAVLSGRHRFVIFIGAVAERASESIELFKKELSENALILQDFPEVCYPLSLLDNEPRRCIGQRYRGKKTNIRWGKDRIVLPTIPESAASGSVIHAASLEGQILGLWVRLPNGKIQRPTLAICDDPQTPESSRSQGPNGQTTYRLKTIKQSVQGLAGPDQQTAILVPCTVIEIGDLAAQLVDRTKNPEFRGERTQRFYSWPTNAALWDTYREMRERAMRTDQPLTEAIEFYKARMCTQGRRMDDSPAKCGDCSHKATCMDCGAQVDWDERRDDPRNLSSVQAAMHSLYKYGEAGFASEFQNDPLASDSSDRLPTVDEITAKAAGYKRGVVPAKAAHITAFIDVGDDYLAWVTGAWSQGFDGGPIDYGTWPDQGLTFSKAKPRKTLQQMYPGTGPDGAILAGVKDLLKRLLDRQFTREVGAPQQIGLCLVDTGYKPDVVYAAIRSLARGPVVRASRGQGITAGKKQFEDYRRDRCREMGTHWWVPKDSPHAVVQIDTNFWKTFVHDALSTAAGDPGAMTLFGQPAEHTLFASHVLAEYYTLPKTETGVVVREYHQHIGRDNELFDCLVGACVAASKLGCALIPVAGRSGPRPVKSFAQREASRS